MVFITLTPLLLFKINFILLKTVITTNLVVLGLLNFFILKKSLFYFKTLLRGSKRVFGRDPSLEEGRLSFFLEQNNFYQKLGKTSSIFNVIDMYIEYRSFDLVYQTLLNLKNSKREGLSKYFLNTNLSFKESTPIVHNMYNIILILLVLRVFATILLNIFGFPLLYFRWVILIFSNKEKVSIFFLTQNWVQLRYLSGLNRRIYVTINGFFLNPTKKDLRGVVNTWKQTKNVILPDRVPKNFISKNFSQNTSNEIYTRIGSYDNIKVRFRVVSHKEVMRQNIFNIKEFLYNQGILGKFQQSRLISTNACNQSHYLYSQVVKKLHTKEEKSNFLKKEFTLQANMVEEISRDSNYQSSFKVVDQPIIVSRGQNNEIDSIGYGFPGKDLINTKQFILNNVWGKKESIFFKIYPNHSKLPRYSYGWIESGITNESYDFHNKSLKQIRPNSIERPSSRQLVATHFDSRYVKVYDNRNQYPEDIIDIIGPNSRIYTPSDKFVLNDYIINYEKDNIISEFLSPIISFSKLKNLSNLGPLIGDNTYTNEFNKSLVSYQMYRNLDLDRFDNLSEDYFFKKMVSEGFFTKEYLCRDRELFFPPENISQVNGILDKCLVIYNEYYPELGIVKETSPEWLLSYVSEVIQASTTPNYPNYDTHNLRNYGIYFEVIPDGF